MALISVIAIPLSLVAAGVVLYLHAGHHQHDGTRRVRRRARRRSWTMRSSMSRTSSGGCARSGSPAARKSTARIVLDASLEVRPAICAGDAHHRARGDAGILHGRARWRVFRAARARFHSRDARVHGGCADRDTRTLPAPAQSRGDRAARVAAGAVAEAPLRRDARARDQAPRRATLATALASSSSRASRCGRSSARRSCRRSRSATS